MSNYPYFHVTYLLWKYIFNFGTVILNEYIHVIHVRIVQLATLKLLSLYEGHQEKRGKKQRANKQYKVKKGPVSSLWYFIPNKDEVPWNRHNILLYSGPR